MTITVVNMIPKDMSTETNQDSEPNLTVSPTNPLNIAASAFTPNPNVGNAPIYVSVDGGSTWKLNPIVPSRSMTADITLRFSDNYLYAGIIRQPTSPQLVFEILRTKDFKSSATMEVLLSRFRVDQPWVQVMTMQNGSNKGKDLLCVGDNDLGNRPLSATIDLSFDAGAQVPSFNTIRIDSRSGITRPQDSPAIRPVIHTEGKVYAAFYEWTSLDNDNIATANVVVVRDDNFGMGPSPFSALRDPNDGNVGAVVVKNLRVPFDMEVGQQRLGGDLSLIVDPTNSSTVYLVYSEQKSSNDDYTLHAICSTDGGSTWSDDIRTIISATNPGIAISKDGKLGLLYQQFIEDENRWKTHFEVTQDNFKTKQDNLLADVPADDPQRQFDPFLGDYLYLMAHGTDFYGIFCADNTPDKNNFPSKVIYQRNADFGRQKLLDLDNSTIVRNSIDPFFFKVTKD